MDSSTRYTQEKWVSTHQYIWKLIKNKSRPKWKNSKQESLIKKYIDGNTHNHGLGSSLLTKTQVQKPKGENSQIGLK